MEKKFLLIQKDSPFVAECIQFFKAKGWEVEHCSSGAMGLEKISSLSPEIIVVGQEPTGFNVFTILKNISTIMLASQSLLFIADEDFLKKIERDHEKWESVTPHIVKMPVEIEKLYQYCEERRDTETSRLWDRSILYKFPKTVVTESKKNAAVVSEAPKKDIQEVKKESEKHVKKEYETSPTDSNEVKTLKQYLALKEKELAELQADFGRSQEQVGLASKKALEDEAEYKKMVDQQETLHKKMELISRENEELRQRFSKDVKSREQEVQTKSDKLLLAERKCEIAEKKYEELKERVRKDIQQIRIHEKELEARLEILKRDSETLLAAKDRKLLEFKRKIDSLEYEMESLIEKEKAAQKKIGFWKERINRVLRALKLGTSLLESEEDMEQEISKISAEGAQATQPSITATKKSTKAA